MLCMNKWTLLMSYHSILRVVAQYDHMNNFGGGFQHRGVHLPDTEHYIGKHYIYGPLFQELPRLKAYEVRAITDRADYTKRQIKHKLDEWVAKQPDKIKEVYNAFDKESKMRVLREKMDHEQHIANEPNEVRDIDRKILEHLDNPELSWYETCRRINAIKHECDPKILKALGIERRTKCGVNPKPKETEDQPRPASYEDFGFKRKEEDNEFNGMNNNNNNINNVDDGYDTNDGNDYNNYNEGP